MFTSSRFPILAFLLSLAVLHSCNAQHRPSTHITKINLTGDVVTSVSDSIWVIFQDKDGNYWYGSNGQGVFRYDQVNKTILRLSMKHGLSNDSIREIQQDRNGAMYFGTMNGICRYDGYVLNELTPIKSNDSMSGWRLEPGDLWFKGNSNVNGPYRYDGRQLFDLDFPKHELEEELIAQTGIRPWSNYGVYTIYNDSKGNIWFGTSAFGACRFDGKELIWISENEITFRTDAFGVRGIIEDRNGWMLLTNTIFKYSITENELTHNDESVTAFVKEKGIGNGECPYFQSIVKDSLEHYWMVTYMKGVWRYEATSGKMIHYPILKNEVQIPLVSIYKDREGKLWLATQEDGVYFYNDDVFEKFGF